MATTALLQWVPLYDHQAEYLCILKWRVSIHHTQSCLTKASSKLLCMPRWQPLSLNHRVHLYHKMTTTVSPHPVPLYPTTTTTVSLHRSPMYPSPLAFTHALLIGFYRFSRAWVSLTTQEDHSLRNEDIAVWRLVSLGHSLILELLVVPLRLNPGGYSTFFLLKCWIVSECRKFDREVTNLRQSCTREILGVVISRMK